MSAPRVIQMTLIPAHAGVFLDFTIHGLDAVADPRSCGGVSKLRAAGFVHVR